MVCRTRAGLTPPMSINVLQKNTRKPEPMQTPLLQRIKRSPYSVNLWALMPRHWFIPLVCVASPFLIYINIDGGPNSDDSGHYFMLWFLGLIYLPFGVALRITGLMNKPLSYCMPTQQRVLRRLVLAIGVLATSLMYMVAVIPESSHWVPPNDLGLVSPWLIGLMIYMLMVTLASRRAALMSGVTAGLVLIVALLVSIYFRGSGSDIVRPPDSVFLWLSVAALGIIPICWHSLGQSGLRRRLVGAESTAAEANVTTQLQQFNLYQRAVPPRGASAQDPHTGNRWLALIQGSKPNSLWRTLLDWVYRMRIATDPWRVVGVWAMAIAISTHFSLRLKPSFEPAILFGSLTMLAVYQGAMVFRTPHSPFIPRGRRVLFAERMLNAGLRYLLVVAVGLVICSLAWVFVDLWPQLGLGPYGETVLTQHYKSYLYPLILAPLMLFISQRSRSPIWILISMFACWFTIYQAPAVSNALADWHVAWLITVLILAWLPFVVLAYRRSFKADLAFH